MKKRITIRLKSDEQLEKERIIQNETIRQNKSDKSLQADKLLILKFKEAYLLWKRSKKNGVRSEGKETAMSRLIKEELKIRKELGLFNPKQMAVLEAKAVFNSKKYSKKIKRRLNIA